MLQPNELPHSSFADAHKGIEFVIRLKSFENGYTATLEVEGLPPRKYSDKSWTDRKQAISDVSNDAIEIIESMSR